MATTTKQALPYPLGTAAPFVHLDLKSLAEAIDGRLITVCTSSTRPSGAAAFASAWIFETDTLAYGVHDGTTWRMWDTVGQTYTPVVSSSGSAISQGTQFGRYFRRGRHVSVTTRWATSTQGGSLDTTFTLPGIGNANITLMPLLRGVAHLAVSGVSGYWGGAVRLASTSTFQVYMPNSQTDVRQSVLRNTDGGGGAGAGVPAIGGTYTLVSGGEVTTDFDYELQ